MQERKIKQSIFSLGVMGLGVLFFLIFQKPHFYLQQIPPAQLTEFQFRFENALNLADAKALESSFNLFGLFREATQKLGRFSKGQISSYVQQQQPYLGLGQELLNLAPNLHSRHFLGIKTGKDSEGDYLIFRSYHAGVVDFLVVRVALFQGKVQAYDYFVFSRGEWRSEKLQRTIQTNALNTDRISRSVRLRLTNEAIETIATLDQLLLRQAHQDAYRHLMQWDPAGTRESIDFAVRGIQIGFYLEDESLFATTRRYLLGQKDPWLQAVAEYYDLLAQYGSSEKERQTLKVLRERVGEDFLLDLFKAKIDQEEQLYLEAERSYLKVIAAYPFLMEPYFYLLHCIIEQEDHQRGLDLLVNIKEKFNMTDSQIEDVIRQYPTLLESMAYRRYKGIKEI